jgi:arginine deiminase
MQKLGVYSEVGRLKKVMVHQPGWEHRKMVPWNREAMLCDDIIDIESARPEHKEFVLKMRNHGVEVIYFTDLLKEICSKPALHEEVVKEVVFGLMPEDVDPKQIQPTHLIMGYPENYTFDEQVLLEPTPNLYFMRDPAFFVHDKLIISHPCKSIRQREAYLLRAVVNRHPVFDGVDVYDGILNDPSATLEGGDVLVVDEETVLVGISERSNEAGANHLARYLFENTSITRLIKIHIPKKHEFMHLDTVFTFVDRQQIVTLPYIWEKPELYADVAQRVKRQVEALGGEYNGPNPDDIAAGIYMEVVSKGGKTVTYKNALEGLAELDIIEQDIIVTVGGASSRYSCPEEHILEALREQWNDGANTFALKPGHVITYARNDKTIQALEDVMVEVTPFNGGELVRGRGGARCMTMPIERDPI